MAYPWEQQQGGPVSTLLNQRRPPGPQYMTGTRRGSQFDQRPPQASPRPFSLRGQPRNQQNQNMQNYLNYLTGQPSWRDRIEFKPYTGNLPGLAGVPWLTRVLADPYNAEITDAGLQEALDATEAAYKVASARNRGLRQQSGAGYGGVAQAGARADEVARAQGMTETVRDFEKWRQSVGDQRLMQLLLPWLQTFNQGFGVAHGQPTQGNNFLGDLAGLAGGAGAIIGGIGALCWVAREVYGEHDPRWHKVREWVLSQAPDEFRDWYAVHGPEVARRARNNPGLKATLRPVFDRILDDMEE